MPKIIIADTSCFIILSNIGELELLKEMYIKVFTTKEVATEYGQVLPNWIEILCIKGKQKQLILEMQLDKGESSAIALALEIPNSTVILDDFKARKIAKNLGVSFTGTIGMVIKAKLTGIIPSIKPILKKLRIPTSECQKTLSFKHLKKLVNNF